MPHQCRPTARLGGAGGSACENLAAPGLRREWPISSGRLKPVPPMQADGTTWWRRRFRLREPRRARFAARMANLQWQPEACPTKQGQAARLGGAGGSACENLAAPGLRREWPISSGRLKLVPPMQAGGTTWWRRRFRLREPCRARFAVRMANLQWQASTKQGQASFQGFR